MTQNFVESAIFTASRCSGANVILSFRSSHRMA